MKNDKKIEKTMWELHSFINTWSEAADDGICDAYTDNFIEAVIDTAAKLKKLYWEEKEMKKFKLKDYKEFCKEALICPPFEDDEQIEEWFETHKVHIIANDCVMELEYDADTINEIEFSLKEIHEAIFGDGTPTTGNTKYTSVYLLRNYFKSECDKVAEELVSYDRVYQRLIRAAKDECVLSDVAECIRIENDLRNSEVQVLYDDFKNGKLLNIIEEIAKEFMMSQFATDYSQEGDKTFLMFYGRCISGDVIDFQYGGADVNDFGNVPREEVNDFWNEMLANA